ncbi:triose-phosphate transporter [Trichoderma arundinaceum]|uniref:Triose-phosphate transporter n=1 Tax=Trichoderma arundinaceum TaxID=490622 RepID=A0A395NKL9_TRIAR|nr:triose-phosphate transporter [Trichoderma arundinaceum]
MRDLEETRDKEGVEDASPLFCAAPDEATEAKSTSGSFQAAAWMIVNTLATVFTNKAIFSEPRWKQCQLTFAAIHFFMTWFALFLLSRSSIGVFVPRRAPIGHLIPLAAAMCFNVVLPNLSLAYSTVTFYQIARILLTPTVAIMNFVLYREVLPRGAIISLVPACLGVGMVTYYDSIPSEDETIMTTSVLGVVFAFTGIFASSLYTVWIAGYHRKLNMNSMQLLYLQAPMAWFLLLFFIPIFDKFPDPGHTPSPLNKEVLVIASTLFASLVNISQFYIVAQAGPVSSTVVGHIKTCAIVGLGWIISGRTISDQSAVGVIIAVAGITSCVFH